MDDCFAVKKVVQTHTAYKTSKKNGDERKKSLSLVNKSIVCQVDVCQVPFLSNILVVHCSRSFYYLECGMIIPHYRREDVRLLRCVMAELSFRTPQAIKIK